MNGVISRANLIDPQMNSKSIDRLIAAILIVLFSPIWFVNFLYCFCKGLRSPLRDEWLHDGVDRWAPAVVFSDGFLPRSLLLLSVVCGHLRLLGISTQVFYEKKDINKLNQYGFTSMESGIFSLTDLYRWTGQIHKTPLQILSMQIKASRHWYTYIVLLVRIVMGYLVYGGKSLKQDLECKIFGIKINNYSLEDALLWIKSSLGSASCKIVFFVNVNSINIAYSNLNFKNTFQSADKVFADGAGIRIAAAHMGQHLKANINGTDLLPLLCKLLVSQNKSIFLLGSEPGIAESAAKNIKKTYIDLSIAGTHHGYFKSTESKMVIDKINASGASVLLVGFGSPLQEDWLIANRNYLNCDIALAVGGLFDFYSGKIPRAPEWVREIGMEWLWRLWQEPVKKFNRYVIGNPLFLIRTFLLNKAEV